MSLVEKKIQESIETKQAVLADKELIVKIQTAAKWIGQSLSKNRKVLLCGNGGSASDALHLAGELLGRFQKERQALPAIALNADVAVMTAIANDYGYEAVYERAVEGYLNPGDVLIGISTSGNSENIYRAVKKAGEMGGVTIGLLGRDGGRIKDISDLPIIVPSECTARVQEAHIMIGHIICEIVEERLYEKREGGKFKDYNL